MISVGRVEIVWGWRSGMGDELDLHDRRWKRGRNWQTIFLLDDTRATDSSTSTLVRRLVCFGRQCLCLRRQLALWSIGQEVKKRTRLDFILAHSHLFAESLKVVEYFRRWGLISCREGCTGFFEVELERNKFEELHTLHHREIRTDSYHVQKEEYTRGIMRSTIALDIWCLKSKTLLSNQAMLEVYLALGK